MTIPPGIEWQMKMHQSCQVSSATLAFGEGRGTQPPVSWIVTSETQARESPQACLQQPEARTEGQAECAEDRAFPLALGTSGRHHNAAAEKRAQPSCCSKASASNPGSLMELKSHKRVMGWGRGEGAVEAGMGQVWRRRPASRELIC